MVGIAVGSAGDLEASYSAGGAIRGVMLVGGGVG